MLVLLLLLVISASSFNHVVTANPILGGANDGSSTEDGIRLSAPPVVGLAAATRRVIVGRVGGLAQRASLEDELMEQYNSYDAAAMNVILDSIDIPPDFAEIYQTRLREILLREAANGYTSYLLKIPNTPVQTRDQFNFPTTVEAYANLVKWYLTPPKDLETDNPRTIERKDRLYRDAIYDIQATWNRDQNVAMNEISPLTFSLCWTDCPKDRVYLDRGGTSSGGGGKVRSNQRTATRSTTGLKQQLLARLKRNNKPA